MLEREDATVLELTLSQTPKVLNVLRFQLYKQEKLLREGSFNSPRCSVQAIESECGTKQLVLSEVTGAQEFPV